MTNWPALAPELTDQPFVVDPSQFIRSPDHFDLGYTQGHAATVMVAASDTPGTLKRLAQQKYRCDGTADDATIQAAIDSLPSGGGEILLLQGSYSLADGITVGDNVTLSGEGPATILTPSNSHDGVGSLIENSDQAGGNSNVTLRNFAIAPNATLDMEQILFDGVTNGVVDSVVYSGSSGVYRRALTLDNCSNIRVVNCLLDAFQYVLYIGSGSSDVFVHGTQVDGQSDRGIFVAGTDVVIQQCRVLDGTYGIYLAGARTIVQACSIVTDAETIRTIGATDSVIANCVLRSVGTSFVRCVEINGGTERLLFTGNSLSADSTGSVSGLIYVNDQVSTAIKDIVIRGNLLSAVDFSTDNAWPGIWVADDTTISKINVIGNTFVGATGAQFDNCVELAGANITDCLVIDNDMRGAYGTAAISDGATGTIFTFAGGTTSPGDNLT